MSNHLNDWTLVNWNTSENEIQEKDWKWLVRQSTSYVQKYVLKHQDLLYKGIPLAIALYMFYPVLVVGWYWLPWLWAIYNIYQSIPPGGITLAMRMARRAIR